MKHRVLLVDVAGASRAALAEALRERGFEVVAAGDLEELEAALALGGSDLLLLDVHLPDVFGYDLVPWLREYQRIDRPILLYSPLSSRDLQALVDGCGADGFVRKTGRPEDAATAIARYLTERAAEEAAPGP